MHKVSNKNTYRHNDILKNTKAMIRSVDGDTDFLRIVTSILLVDTLALYTFMICLDDVLRKQINLHKEK